MVNGFGLIGILTALKKYLGTRGSYVKISINDSAGFREFTTSEKPGQTHVKSITLRGDFVEIEPKTGKKQRFPKKDIISWR